MSSRPFPKNVYMALKDKNVKLHLRHEREDAGCKEVRLSGRVEVDSKGETRVWLHPHSPARARFEVWLVDVDSGRGQHSEVEIVLVNELDLLSSVIIGGDSVEARNSFQRFTVGVVVGSGPPAVLRIHDRDAQIVFGGKPAAGASNIGWWVVGPVARDIVDGRDVAEVGEVGISLQAMQGGHGAMPCMQGGV